MSLIAFCVRYPVTVWVGVLLAVLFGGIALARLPLQMIPTVDRPEITVETEYKGAGPLEVEREITRRMEEKLNSVENLREMTSTSVEGKSTIVLKFDWGVNKDIARLDVSEKLDLVTDVPEDAEQPQIRALNTDEESPIAWIIVETARDLNRVWEEVEDVIVPRFERVAGVGAVWRFGGQKRQVHVVLDQRAMAARGLTVADVREAIVRENRTTKGGQISRGTHRTVVRTMGEFTDVRQIEDVVLRPGVDGRGIAYLRDVARVTFGHEDRDFAVRANGRPSIGLGVLRRSGANTVDVMQGIKAELAQLNELYRGKGIRLAQAYDETDYINESLTLVSRNILVGSALAVVMLLLFLRSLSSVLVIALAIPVSLVTTFVVLGALGRSLNIISLAGLAFASGMVIDNAVVVLENIVRHRETGKDRVRAALDGAAEVWGALVASTLTTVAVFLPILFVTQEAGQLFRDIAIAISAAVLLSLVVAVTVVPMLSARLVSGRPRASRGPGALLDRLGRGGVETVVGLLGWLRRGVLRRVVVAGAIVAAAVAVALYLAPPMDYLPQGNRNLFFVIVRTPPGYSTEQKEEILGVLERRFATLPQVERYFSVVRVEQPIMGVLAKPEWSSLPDMRRILGELRARSAGVPGAEAVFVTQSPLFRRRGGGFFGGATLELNARGHELEQIRRIAERLEGELRRFPGANFVNSSFEWGNPELRVVVDRERAAAVGLGARDVGYIVETAVGGTLAGRFREGGKELDIKLLSSDRRAQSLRDVDRAVFATRSGGPLRLTEIVQVRPATGPTKVNHVDMDRAITLTVSVREDMPLEAALAAVERDIVRPAQQALPLGYSIDITGQARDLTEAWLALRWSYVLALLVTYLLMASLFESWVRPFYIMFSVPLAVAGGIAAVRVANAFEPSTKMDTVTMLGFVILAGIVVNNAILIVHQARNLMNAGGDAQEALLESVRTRIRPIFITTTTTVFGMLPLVVASGSGSELYRGLGAAVMGGLVTSTLITLVLVPTVYSLGLDAQGALRHRLGRAANRARHFAWRRR